MTAGLSDYYKGGAEYGSVLYRPATLLKMLLISFLYELSERETEHCVADSLAARYFVGIAANEPVPDYSTQSVFRDRIMEKGGTQAYEELFRRVVRLAREKRQTACPLCLRGAAPTPLTPHLSYFPCP